MMVMVKMMVGCDNNDRDDDDDDDDDDDYDRTCFITFKMFSFKTFCTYQVSQNVHIAQSPQAVFVHTL